MPSPEEGMKTLIRNLEQSTGKTIDSWIDIGRATGFTKHREILKFIQNEHGLSYGYANQIALRTLQAAAATGEGASEVSDPIDAQYAGAKAAVKPIYDAVLACVRSFGEVEVSPKKAYVSLRRSKQFCVLQPTTATRLDVGIILKGVPATDRLEPSGSFNAMVTHRVRLSNVGDVDSELAAWLRDAYDAA